MDDRTLLTAGLLKSQLLTSAILPDPGKFDGQSIRIVPQNNCIGPDAVLPSVPAAQTELVVFDENVLDYQFLVKDLLTSQQSSHVYDIAFLDPQRDPFEQLDPLFASGIRFSAVHFISHGSVGMIQLGNTYLDSANLDRYAEDLVGWRNGLEPGADLLFYACDVAADPSGQTLLREIGNLTGTVVAGKVDDTGDAALGGNWNLEFQTGPLHTSVPFSQSAQQDWHGLLAAGPVINPDPDTGGNYNATYYANTPGVAVEDVTDATITDAASPTLVSLRVQIQNPHNGSNEILFANTTGTLIAASFSGGTLTLSGTDTLADYQQVLRTVMYQDRNPHPNTSAVRNIFFTADDGTTVGPTATTYVTVSTASVFASSTTVVSSQNPSVYGQAVTFTATVSPVPPGVGTPTGTVTFMDGTTTLGTATLSGGTATLTTSAFHAGSHSITVDYGGDIFFLASTSTPVTQTVNPALLTVTADNQTKVYGAALPTLTSSYSGFVNGDTSASLTTQPTLSTPATAASHVGTYSITASGAADPDYAISYQPGILSITPAPLTITADNQTMVYGSALPSLTVSYSGLVNGDTPASLSTPPTVSTTATATSRVGGYAITASGAADPDYAISYQAGTLTITPAPSTVTKLQGAPSQTLIFSPLNDNALASLATPPSGGTTATGIDDKRVPLNTPASAAILQSSLNSSLATRTSVGNDAESASRTGRAINSPRPTTDSTDVAPSAPPSEKPAEVTSEIPPVQQTQAVPPPVPMPPVQTNSVSRSLEQRLSLQSSLLKEYEESLPDNSSTLSKVVTIGFSTAAFASAGYVVLTSRAGLMLLSLLTATPVWKRFDPIEILFAWEHDQEEERKKRTGPEEERLQDLVQKKQPLVAQMPT